MQKTKVPGFLKSLLRIRAAGGFCERESERAAGPHATGAILATSSSYHHGDLKPALIKAAGQILRTKGVGGLSLRAIASEIGVSHMAPYAHFKNKQELLLAVAAAGFEELAERMTAARPEKQRGRELAVTYGIEYLNYALENPELYRIMMSQIDPLPAGQAGNSGNSGKAGESASAGPAKAQSARSDEIRASLRRPFLLLYAAFKNSRLDKKTAQARAIGAWSTVHGMAALIIDGHLAVPEGMDVVELFKAAVGSRQA